MKQIILYLFTLTLLVGCNDTATNKPGNIEQTDNNLYFGKLILNDSSKHVLESLVTYKTFKFDVLIGCECDEEVGDYTNKESKKKDEKRSDEPTIKQMELADYVLDSLQHTEKEFWDHIYVRYRKVAGTTSTETPMIVGFKIDLVDKTKLEKVTVYTANATVSSKQKSDPKEFNSLSRQESEKPIVDTVSIKLDSNTIQKDTATTKQRKKPR
jgi:hypothetical protein